MDNEVYNIGHPETKIQAQLPNYIESSFFSFVFPDLISVFQKLDQNKKEAQLENSPPKSGNLCFFGSYA